MAEYLILIHGDEQRWNSMTPAERAEIDDAHRALREKAGGAILASGELEASSTAVTLRLGEGGEVAATDGPFAEAKEVVGGFYVITAPDRDAAVALVADLAEARHDHSGVQVQPLVDHSAD